MVVANMVVDVQARYLVGRRATHLQQKAILKYYIMQVTHNIGSLEWNTVFSSLIAVDGLYPTRDPAGY